MVATDINCRYKTKTFKRRKTGNEGIQRILSKTVQTGWPHPSLDGEVAEWLLVFGRWLMERTFWRLPATTINPQLSTSSARRAQPNRYPDFGLNLAPAFPVTLAQAQWLWEFVVRYSGATVPDFH